MDFDEIYFKYSKLIKYYIRKIISTKNKDDFEDVEQECWIQIIRSIEQLKDYSKISSFIISVTVRTSLRYLNKKIRDDKFKQEINNDSFLHFSYDQEHFLTNTYSDIDCWIEKETLYNSIKRAHLSERESKIISMIMIDNLNNKEIAIILSLTTNNIGAIKNRAINKIRKIVNN